MLGLPGAPECSGVQPSAELTSQVLQKAPKIPNAKSCVGVDDGMNNVVVNNSHTPIK